MAQSKDHYYTLTKLPLPEEIFEYFDIVQVDIVKREVHIHLDEKAIKPEEYELAKLISKGFHPAAIVKDFPLLDKAMFLQVRRRRWFCKSTGKIVERDWDSVAKETRLTKEFATFLRGIFGQLPNQQQ
ncbi:hypothetical protein SAMN05444274_101656 [Mariniphaga anaerophila]|uniref:Transposase n=1 Tax=Mariniphaga anaerophila TaxID=1484053 RepID=A0A1M4UE98_9BACT|nr:hypothetical protein [Mariniphaga anaerophila]SHE54946.1 hypothetical protein SAMN05444274_101656 [Mariniphaga anaerophila]